MFIEVKNLNGTTDNTPPSQYSSWQEWWENKKMKNLDTAHVKIVLI